MPLSLAARRQANLLSNRDLDEGQNVIQRESRKPNAG
jgi:hypothetical protein